MPKYSCPIILIPKLSRHADNEVIKNFKPFVIMSREKINKNNFFIIADQPLLSFLEFFGESFIDQIIQPDTLQPERCKTIAQHDHPGEQ